MFIFGLYTNLTELRVDDCQFDYILASIDDVLQIDLPHKCAIWINLKNKDSKIGRDGFARETKKR